MVIIPRRKVELSMCEIFIALKNLLSQRYPQESLIATFEKRFARLIGVKYAIAMPTARIGLAVFLDTVELEKGDEVIMSSYNYHVVAALFKYKRLKPIFVDIDAKTWNMDPDLIEAKITPRTKMVLATHLYGRICDMDRLTFLCQKHNILLIEDAAHACGTEYKNRRAGSFGDLACFSFGTGKALVTLEGAILATNNERIASNLRSRLEADNVAKKRVILQKLMKPLIETISTKRVIFPFFVYPILYLMNCLGSKFIEEFTEDKYVLEEGRVTRGSLAFTRFQAALGIEQLKRLEDLNNKRIFWGMALNRLLSGIEQIQLPLINGGKEHINLYYGIVTQEAKALRKYLLSRGVDTKMGSMRACSALDFLGSEDLCPIAERISPNVIELPCYPSLTLKEVYYLANLIRRFYQKERLEPCEDRDDVRS